MSRQLTRSRVRAILVLVGLSGLWVASVASRVIWNGDVYGLDYGVFHPDGACYTQFTYDMAGQQSSGTTEIVQTYITNGTSFYSRTNESGDLETDCYGGPLESRILYSLVSIPFVLLFGIHGMLVIPALSWLAATIIPAGILIRRGFYMGAAVAGTLVLASTTVARWSVANLVDPLLMGLIAVTLLFLPIFRKSKKSDLIWLALLATLGALTRQSFPIWIAIALGPWIAAFLLRRRSKGGQINGRNAWTKPLVVLSSVSLIAWLAITLTLGSQNGPAVLVNWLSQVSTSPPVASPVEPELQSADPTIPPKVQAVPPISSPGPGSLSDVAPLTGEEKQQLEVSPTFVQRLADETLFLVEGVVRVAISEVGQLTVLDRSLLLLLTLACVGTWKWRRWPAGYAFISVLFATGAITAFNGTLGTNFRFQLSVIPFAALMAGLAFPSPMPGGLRNGVSDGAFHPDSLSQAGTGLTDNSQSPNQ